MTWLPQESIRIKRDGGTLDAAELARIVRAIADGSLSDAQVGAFAMAVTLRGMTPAECADFTRAVRDSGEVFDWRAESPPGPVLDKHSTGGVGDLVSLALGPMLAACGAWVPMIVGRGLAHTGGTLDKLESIPGYQSRPPPERVRRAVREAGVAIVGAGDRIAPADRRLYAIRDVTATVDCLPLIVASILSKKLAAGLEALVLDIKYGNGAVLPEPERGRELARAMISTAAAAGLPLTALLTDMSEPLARSAGNALEVHEAIAMLRGERTDRAADRSDARARCRGHGARQGREGREGGAFVTRTLDHERRGGGALRAHGREPRRAGRHPGKAGRASREGGARGRRARGAGRRHRRHRYARRRIRGREPGRRPDRAGQARSITPSGSTACCRWGRPCGRASPSPASMRPTPAAAGAAAAALCAAFSIGERPPKAQPLIERIS